jgi:acetyl-CoA synthetase
MSNESVQLIYPSDEIVKNAAVSGMDAYRALCAEAEADYEGYWARHARDMVTWKEPFTQVLDESNAPFFKWFADGKLNVSYNCLDRNVEAGLGDKVAIIFEADNGEVHQGYLQRTAGQGLQNGQCPAPFHGCQEG